MMRSVLLITAVAGVAECAQAMEKQLGLRVDMVADRRAGLAALRREEYAVVILDENLALADAAATDVETAASDVWVFTSDEDTLRIEVEAATNL